MSIHPVIARLYGLYSRYTGTPLDLPEGMPALWVQKLTNSEFTPESFLSSFVVPLFLEMEAEAVREIEKLPLEKQERCFFRIDNAHGYYQEDSFFADKDMPYSWELEDLYFVSAGARGKGMFQREYHENAGARVTYERYYLPEDNDSRFTRSPQPNVQAIIETVANAVRIMQTQNMEEGSVWAVETARFLNPFTEFAEGYFSLKDEDSASL
jgi:hypothetical protein